MISKEALQKALSSDVQDTYNMISVDGDTSTNDTVLLLANGAAGNEEIKEGTPEYEAFCQALHEINVYLAKKIAGDGEGATALFEAKVIGAETKEQAKTLAKSIVCSDLTKTAIAGHDCQLGAESSAPWDIQGHSLIREKVDLFFREQGRKDSDYGKRYCCCLQRGKSDRDSLAAGSDSHCGHQDGNGRSICMGMRPYI